MKSPTDHQAIRASVAEPARFGVIFDRHVDAIARFTRHSVGGDAGDDIAAETFVRAFAARERYVPRTADARAWLFAIATNLVRDEGRRRARALGLDDRLAQQADSRAKREYALPDPDLRLALEALRAEEREVLVLLAWAELSYEEIAEATGVPVGTVRSRLSRARSHLRERLAESIPSPGGP